MEIKHYQSDEINTYEKIEEEKSKERGFEGIWIPAEIWLDETLTPTEKCMIAEIKSLDKSSKRCYASNSYFAEFFKMKEKSVSNMISDLRKRGYIEQVYFNGRTRGLAVLKSESRLHLKMDADSTFKGMQGTLLNGVYNKDNNKENIFLSAVAENEENEILKSSINSNPRSGKANAVIESYAKSYTKELDSRYISFAKIYNFKETNPTMQGLWNKLTEEEKDRVVTHVVKYFEYQPDKSYIVDAKKYLIDKKFDFDVIDKRPKPPKKDLISV